MFMLVKVVYNCVSYSYVSYFCCIVSVDRGSNNSIETNQLANNKMVANYKECTEEIKRTLHQSHNSKVWKDQIISTNSW